MSLNKVYVNNLVPKEQIHILDSEKLYEQSELKERINDVKEEIELYKDNIYGLYSDNKLLGYAYINPESITTSTIHIDFFNAVKGHGTIFLDLLREYLVDTYHPDKLSVRISTYDKNFLRMLNFWFHNNFVATKQSQGDQFYDIDIIFTLSIKY